ncbi:Dipeptidyl aminopeptidase/acylaminoacyl peptidase [Granulicella pectinivorans]|uniref:Dipeptidyl aminopeptidase/acylaminoacyl peptidase n=1 Tax=Granulicella pectinivorans TaxID=474950 RepID=A0A1I6LR11_9BACT|nr:DPP IV N-terminal domain-containing protein [Granulicella pectinivorans]SFS05906.1 Dipeptidyl aminopeptidase/acylaminoacyl peptidase [Granulicella pectinivorans]
MPSRTKPVSRVATSAALLGACLLPLAAVSQQRILTKDDYANAEKFMAYGANPLVQHTMATPTFLPDGRFWYRDTGDDGVVFFMVDPAKGTKTPAFDQVKLAAALNAAMAKAPLPDGMAAPRTIDPHRLPITDFTPGDGQTFTVSMGSAMRMHCDMAGAGTCTPLPGGGQGSGGGRGGRNRAAAELSPDKKKQAFIRDWNLWIRDVKTGEETQLTTDGQKNYGYATDNAGWTHSNNPILVWSPDSNKIATFQQDQRKTGDMYLISTNNGHPKLEAWKYPLAGDKDITMIERVVIDVPAKKVVRFKMPPDQHRSTLCDDISCRGGSGWDDVMWSDDSKSIAFVSTARDHRQEWLRIANPETGDIREVYTETVPKFFESGNGKVNWKYLPASNEFLWFSERDNWGQMYLYDLTTGKLKNQITTGEGNVTQVLRIDEKARVLYFKAVGKEKGWDPYYEAFYRIDFDGKNMKLLSPEKADHQITLSPDGRFFVDVYSTVTEPQTAVVRDDATGRIAVQLGRQDISRLLASGWVPPTPITVKGRDGKTDLYGFMFKPTKIEMGRKYPIINHVYPGPQTGSCGARTFAAAHGDLQSLAELGFVVVCIDGMGTPWRSKTFHEFYYGDMGDATIPDQVAGMKDLAAKYPFIDLSRAGIYGHSGGGNATAGAMFHFPDFFAVGIAESGNHDNREYEDDWAEKWSGLETISADGSSSYDSQANQNYAKNLKGHLLLAHGTFDDNVPPNNTLIVVEQLIKANKDFDLLMIPNVPHGYGYATQYMTRRRWDYFVRYLAGNTPPKEYEMQPPERLMSAMGLGPDADEPNDTEFDVTGNDLWQSK